MEYKTSNGGTTAVVQNSNFKFCKHCGEKIYANAVVCTKCGRQVEELRSNFQSNIIINNAHFNGYGGYHGTPKSKLVAALLCFFLGYLGIHRFYEGKILTGILYFFTIGLFGVGVLVDFIILLCKPSTYYVY